MKKTFHSHFGNETITDQLGTNYAYTIRIKCKMCHNDDELTQLTTTHSLTGVYLQVCRSAGSPKRTDITMTSR